jgi:polysaccharide export outer membrane protein
MKISVIWLAPLVAASGLLAAGGQSAPPAQPTANEEKAGPPSPLTVAPHSQQGQTPSDPASLAAAPAASRVTAGSAPVDEKSYIIGAEDVLGIQVWQVREMTGQYLVRPDGKISVPLAGEIAAAGKTPEQVNAALTEILKEKYINSPDVTVSILQVNSKKYYIHGEVMSPGAYALIVPTTVLEGLANAHGFKDFAGTKKIRIMRGKEQLKFNYNDVTRGKHTEENVFLQPGDEIIVP